ncbi:hypothetical protein [Candidatus Poriferisocius sp.]|uniref:hypothetical protein n=1 Tax=Candidatus Poriferisocius sp. TaxID=3101276 RepID=UPI003B02716C
MSRSIERRIQGLELAEVAVLEVLRGGPTTIETPWTRLAGVVMRLEHDTLIRPWLITEQLAQEHHVAARQRWAELH